MNEKLNKTIETLVKHNTWRRGAEDVDQVAPAEICRALDHAIEVLRVVAALETVDAARPKHSTKHNPNPDFMALGVPGILPNISGVNDISAGAPLYTCGKFVAPNEL